MSPCEKITKQPLVLIYFDNTFVLVHITRYVHIPQVYTHTSRIYRHRWSSIIAYSVYIPSVSLDMLSIMRYVRKCSYKRACRKEFSCTSGPATQPHHPNHPNRTAPCSWSGQTTSTRRTPSPSHPRGETLSVSTIQLPPPN